MQSILIILILNYILKAMIFQLITAFGAIIGTYFGLWLLNTSSTNFTEPPIYVLPFTAGGFIYIACTCVLPEMLADQCGFLQSFIEIIGMVFGFSIMEILSSTHVH